MHVDPLAPCFEFSYRLNLETYFRIRALFLMLLQDSILAPRAADGEGIE